ALYPASHWCFCSHFPQVPNTSSNSEDSGNRRCTCCPCNNSNSSMLSNVVIVAISCHVCFPTKAQEILRMNIKPTSPASLTHILAPKTTRSHRNLKVNSDPIFRDLIIRLSCASVPPIHAGVTRTILQHQPQRLGRFRVIRTARSSTTAHSAIRRRATLGQVAAKVARTVARRVASLRKPLAEHGLRLDDHVGFAAVEEQVVVLRGEGEVSTCVEAKRSGGTEVVAVLAVPHERVGEKNVGIGTVAYGPNRVASGRRSKLEIARFGAHKEVSVVRAAAAVVDAERVVYGDFAARGSADACLSWSDQVESSSTRSAT
ncbi:hypothetical protein TorRG33x02_128310, partial [Trema orientale]